jgi:hypothetical protein
LSKKLDDLKELDFLDGFGDCEVLCHSILKLCRSPSCRIFGQSGRFKLFEETLKVRTLIERGPAVGTRSWEREVGDQNSKHALLA